MKKLIIVTGLAVCLCGCGTSNVEQEKPNAVTESEARTVNPKQIYSVKPSTDSKVNVSPATTETSTEKSTDSKQRNFNTNQTKTTPVEGTQDTKKVVTPTTEYSPKQIATEQKSDPKQPEEVTKSKNSNKSMKLKSKKSNSKSKKSSKKNTDSKSTSKTACGYTLKYSGTYNITGNHLTRSNGSIRFNGHRETWYSTNEGCGQATAVNIPGKHVADDGTIRDADGYVCVASSDYKFYTVILTSVGPAKVYDCGCSHGTIDVYTCW